MDRETHLPLRILFDVDHVHSFLARSSAFSGPQILLDSLQQRHVLNRSANLDVRIDH